jgi:hypothetical protein
MPDDSMRTVLVALRAGLGVAVAKAGAAAFTGSTAMAAEAAHSLADSANDLIRPSATSSFAVAYVVLAISTVLDLMSIRQSAGQMIRRARHYHREFLEESRVTSDPTLRAVFVEDAVSVSGDVIAIAALALNQITGSSIYQGVAAVLIALVLIRVSLRLIQRSHDFLVGAWAGAVGGPQGHDVAGFTQPLRPAEEDKVRAFLLAYPGVTAIRELLFTFTWQVRASGVHIRARVPGRPGRVWGWRRRRTGGSSRRRWAGRRRRCLRSGPATATRASTAAGKPARKAPSPWLGVGWGGSMFSWPSAGRGSSRRCPVRGRAGAAARSARRRRCWRVWWRVLMG